MQRKTGIVREVYNSGSSTALLIELSDGGRVLKLATEVSPLTESTALVDLEEPRIATTEPPPEQEVLAPFENISDVEIIDR